MERDKLIGLRWDRLPIDLCEKLMEGGYKYIDEKTNEGIFDLNNGLSINCKKIITENEVIFHIDPNSIIYDPTE